ncbi:Uncharacterised protein [Bordetella pertussis]|nr:Uncharacterised protein [Bordetella pertussis]CFU02629.1 Uncharacterised protein [Bordetella pertussis]CFV99786.1 Uncharacterised protein [Bordetella pertussis]
MGAHGTPAWRKRSSQAWESCSAKMASRMSRRATWCSARSVGLAKRGSAWRSSRSTTLQTAFHSELLPAAMPK